MINLNSINLKNIVTYKDQTFTFKPGVSVVRGENRAGKSLLFSSTANLLYFSHPLSEKKDVKSIFGLDNTSSKNSLSSISLELEDRTGSKTNITQKTHGQSVVYEISQDGIDLECKTVTASKEITERVFRQPEEVFYTGTYLTSYRNHPLLHGSYSQRYEFFEKMFSFEIFDFFQEIINNELKALERKAIELDNLKSQTINLIDKDRELIELTQQLAGVETKKARVDKDLTEAMVNKTKLSRWIDLNTRVKESKIVLSKAIQNLAIKIDTSNAFDDNIDLSPVENAIENTEIAYRDCLERDKLQNLLTVKTKELSKLESDLATSDIGASNKILILEDTLNTLRKEEKILDEKIINLKSSTQGKSREQWEKIQNVSKEIEKQASMQFAKELENPVESLAKAAEKLAVVSYQKSDIEKKIKSIATIHKDEEETVCYTCQSRLTSSEIRKVLEGLYRELANNIDSEKYLNAWSELGNKLVKSRAFLKDVESFDAILTQCDTLVDVTKQRTEITANIRSIDTEIKALTSKEENRKLLSSYKLNKDTEIADLKKQLLPFEGITGEAEAERRAIDTAKAFVQSHKAYVLENSRLKSFEVESGIQTSEEEAKTYLTSLDDTLQELNKTHTLIQNSNNNTRIALGILQKEIDTLKSYSKRIEELTKDLEKKVILDRMYQVFSSKGFRLEKISYFIQLFEQTLNKYSKYLFLEPFEFQIKIEKRDLLILAKRNEKVSDVRFLSGSESRCFQLLCLISILSLVPTSKRTNVVILDEMDAGMDTESTRMFYESFIPELKQIVPSVIIITPLGEQGFYFTPDYSYKVRKNNGTSFVEQQVDS